MEKEDWEDFEEKTNIESDMHERYRKMMQKDEELFKDSVSWANGIFLINKHMPPDVILMSVMLRQEYYLKEILKAIKDEKKS